MDLGANSCIEFTLLPHTKNPRIQGKIIIPVCVCCLKEVGLQCKIKVVLSIISIGLQYISNQFCVKARVNLTIFLVCLVSHPIRPKAPSATSIPAILKSLQDEWVSVCSWEHVAHKKWNTTFYVLTHNIFSHLKFSRFLKKHPWKSPVQTLSFPHPSCSRMLWCFTVSPSGSSCRQPARNYHTLSTNTMPPAESLLDSPRRSLLPERVSSTNLLVFNSATLLWLQRACAMCFLQIQYCSKTDNS